MCHVERNDDCICDVDGQLSPHSGGDLMVLHFRVNQSRHPPEVVVDRVVQGVTCSLRDVYKGYIHGAQGSSAVFRTYNYSTNDTVER